MLKRLGMSVVLLGSALALFPVSSFAWERDDWRAPARQEAREYRNHEVREHRFYDRDDYRPRFDRDDYRPARRFYDREDRREREYRGYSERSDGWRR